MSRTIRVPFDGPYDGDVLTETVNSYFAGYVCAKCKDAVLSVILSDCGSSKYHVGVKCDECGDGSSVGDIDIISANEIRNPYLTVRIWAEPPTERSGSDRWEEI